MPRENPRVLLAIADPRLRTAIRMHLCGGGWQVDVARGALHALRERPPHVVLADLESGDFDPLLLLAAARDVTPRLPVVLCGEAKAIAALGSETLGALGVIATLSLPARLDAVAAQLRAVIARSAVPGAESLETSPEVRRQGAGAEGEPSCRSEASA